MFLALLWLVGATTLLYSGAMGDSNRDFHAALQILHHGHWPVAGPAIAHSFHYSALWFYVLAWFSLVTKSWAGVAVLSGILISGVYPLMYVLGRSLGGRSLGLAATGLMALPSWASVYLLVYSHPAVVPAGAALAALAAYWWWRKPSAWRAFCCGFAACIAVHAHIINLGLLLPLSVLFFMANVPLRRKILVCCLAGLGFSILFIPYVVVEAMGGFAELKAGAAYASHTDLVANLAAVPVVLWNGIVGGVPFALHNVVRLDTFGIWLSCFAILGVGATSIAGWARVRTLPQWIWLVGLALVGQTVTGVVLRNYTPFYQILGVLPFVAILIAYGVVRTRFTAAVPLIMILAVFAAGLQWISQRAVAKRGIFNLDVLHVANLRATGDPQTVVRWSFPAWARDHYADTLCGGDHIALFGHLAAAIELSNALEVHLHCPNTVPALYLGYPSETPPSVVSIGAVHQSMASALGVQGTKLGNLVRVPVLRSVGDAGVPVSDASIYPPRGIVTTPPVQNDYSFSAAAGEALVIVSVRNVWNPASSWTVLCADEVQEPLYIDGDSAAYRLDDGCQNGIVRVSSPRPEWIQMFVTQSG